jgi:hypothetical protein
LAKLDDPERALSMGDDLIGGSEDSGAVVLLQCGRESPLAGKLESLIRATGRYAFSMVVSNRAQAQFEVPPFTLAQASAVWVFAEDLLEAYLTVCATDLSWALRARARRGMPVVGVGGGALALGGLFLANRVCQHAEFDLVGGLGWAPRLLVDGGADRDADDGAIARTTVCTLPGLLGVDLGVRGGLRTEGAYLQSVGDEPVVLLGADSGRLLMVSLDPGQVFKIAPPPFAPFERGLLPADTVDALSPERRPTQPVLRQAPPPPPVTPAPSADLAHTLPGSDKLCPMCNRVHKAQARVELAA